MLLPALFLTLVRVDAAPQDANKRTIYTVATAHLDTNWLWTIQDTIENHIPKTLDDNFALFAMYPDYHFNFEGAFHYMMAKEYYPAKYEQLKKYIAAGKWNVAGSWVDAVDANMPSPEALIRQTLYGNGFFKKEFGKQSYDIFLPDCFGFPYSLPSIAKHCGLVGFSTQKLAWGSAAGIPFAVGRWQGVDGSSIVAALDPGSYGTTLPADLINDPKVNAQLDEAGKASGAYVAYRYHGTGDTGGAPSETSVKNLEANMHKPGNTTVLSASSDQLYRDLTPAQISKLPSYDGELLLTTHGTGCYTSQAAMKKFNRENENLASVAESTAYLADWLGGAPYPKDVLTTAWIRFLWHEFHDDLTGTSIPTVYPFSWNDEVLSLNQFSSVTADSMSVIAAAANTTGPGTAIVVYNPVSSTRNDAVVANVAVPTDWKAVQVIDAGGSPVPSQIVSREGGSAKIAFQAKAPSMGISVYHVAGAAQPAEFDPNLLASVGGLESRDYKITLDQNGDVSSIFDKSLGKELLTGPIRLELRDDPSTNWPSWEILYSTVTAKPRTFVSGPAAVKVIENGPARVGLEIVRQADGSTFTQRIYLTPGNGRIDFQNHVSWHTKGTLLKVNFPFASAGSDATYDLGLGSVERGVDTEKKYEVPGQKWADQTDPAATFGVSVLTDCKYGWDKPDDGHLRLTLLHTAKPGNGYTFQATNDLGEHDFTYSLYSHAGDWTHGTWQAAAALNQPLVAVATTSHAGVLNDGFSMIDSSSDQVQVVAAKQAESGNQLIVRVFEKSGRPIKDAVLTFPAALGPVQEVDGQENVIPGNDFKVKGDQLVYSLSRFQPRAFAITLAKNPSVHRVQSTPLTLPFDTTLVANQGTALPAGLDRAIPANLFPKTITREGVKFDLGSVTSNAVSCNGQSIPIPARTNRLELLATSLGADADAEFQLRGDVGVASVKIRVPSFTERIGQWTNRVVDGKVQTDQANFAPAYIKRTPVAWVATHRLRADGSVEPYMFAYVFKIEVPIMRGMTELVLPTMPGVKVLAATAINDPKPQAELAQELYH
jgi:alpha-mannosidase